MRTYYRPIPSVDPARPAGALAIAGGWAWFDRVECLTRSGSAEVIAAGDVPKATLARITAARPALCGISMDRPTLMGILNVTPDSFSDGGEHFAPDVAVSRASVLAEEAAIIDIGGESTRPGAVEVSVADEIRRTQPVIAAMRQREMSTSVSIDTRKATVARAALDAGANMVNDVSGLGFDADLAPLVAERRVPLCLMHSVETPATMQSNPRYDNVLLDVYDFLEDRVALAEAAGIPRRQIIVDPGIGFGKTLEHNLALLSRISLFHSLGCAILLGASRKRFIGTIGGSAEPCARVPGSIAVALAAVAHGVQILRVHDTAETGQALRLFMAANNGDNPEETR